MKSALLKTLSLVSLVAWAPFIQAAGITDPAGDLLATFGGSTARGDLDVLSATVTYDSTTNLFRLTSTLNGAIGSQPNELYVWGVNRGAGTQGFLANGLPGVKFDRVLTLTQTSGTTFVAATGGTTLGANAVTVSGATISVVVSGTLLPSTGFNLTDYTWNLWPRDPTVGTGFVQIADFAPDNANFTTTPGTVTAPVPLPAAAWLLMSGIAGMGAMARRRRKEPARPQFAQ